MNQTRITTLLFTSAGAFALSLACSSVAMAESPPQAACNGKSVGDPCVLDPGGPGTCAKGTCNELDYSQGSPPKAIEVECVVCEAGAGPGTPQVGGGGPGTAPEIGAGAPATKEAPPESSPPENESRCTVSDEPPAPWALGGLLALLGIAALRRRAV